MPSKISQYLLRNQEKRFYKDRNLKITDDEYKKLLEKSTILYVSRLNQYITEERIWELFSMTGKIKRVIMGVNSNDKRPCGFAFVEYFERKDAESAIALFSGCFFDGQFLSCNFDYGYEPGRELGRGIKGGQVKVDSSIKKFKNN